MYTHILVPTDGSELADKAIEQGIGLAKLTGAKLTVLRVTAPPAPLIIEGVAVDYPQDEVRAQIKQRVEKHLVSLEAQAKAAGITAGHKQVQDEQPWKAIVDVAKADGVSLIVMASHGRRGLSALVLGSETQKVLTHTEIPVLVVR